jgi:hypothetical protein
MLDNLLARRLDNRLRQIERAQFSFIELGHEPISIDQATIAEAAANAEATIRQYRLGPSGT